MLELVFGLQSAFSLSAFAESLIENRGDTGNIDLLKRTSAKVPQSLGSPIQPTMASPGPNQPKSPARTELSPLK